MKEIIIGIDLGTTNSEVAVIEDGRPLVIADEKGEKILPSFVGVGSGGEMLVGESARNQYLIFPERTVKSIKRKMGSGERVEMAGESYTPQEISAMILKRLKETAESYLQRSIHKAVITVPAYFNDAQRQATREAGEIAGLEVVRMINEPTAAALSYETGHREGKRILVYDLGGGTFDVSVVQIQDGVVEVISSHGNNHLGGDDFDQKIVEFIAAHLESEYNLIVSELANARQVEARILRAAIAAKKALSAQPFVMIEEEFLTSREGIPVNLALELPRDDYEQMILPYIEETLDSVHIALKNVSMTVSDIDEILLVGGSTRTPLVSQMLSAEIGMIPRGEVDPDLCVATGAAIQAGMIAGDAVSAVLVDVTPYTFGTSVYGELDGMPHPAVFAPIIQKNTSIPVTRSEVYYTLHDNQEAVDVRIYQGEALDATENLLIGEFLIEGLSKAPANSPILLELALDHDGILNVTAVEKKTGLQKKITIENAFAKMDRDSLEQSKGRVDRLFGSGDAPVEAFETADDEELTAAKKLVEKAQGLLANASPDDKDEIIDLIEKINDAIKIGSIEALQAPMEELSEIVYYLDS
ncbi:MAG: Hsp70 family protein [Gammaproteobacteria bacterium]